MEQWVISTRRTKFNLETHLKHDGTPEPVDVN